MATDKVREAFNWLTAAEFLSGVTGEQIVVKIRDVNLDVNKIVIATQIFPRNTGFKLKTESSNAESVMYYDCFITYKYRFAGIVLEVAKSGG